MKVIKFPTSKKPAAPKAEAAGKAPQNPYEQAASIVQAAAGLFNIDFSQVTRLQGDVVANGDNTDPVVYAGEAELAMRRLVSHFGFERLPLTWGELNGLIEYCENLWVAAGGGQDPKHVARAQAAAREVDLEYQPWRVPAFDAYVAGDMEELRRIHREDKTLERIAREWQEFPYPEGHPLSDASAE